MQGDSNNNEYSFVKYSFGKLLLFIMDCLALLIDLTVVVGSFGYAVAMIVSYPEYITLDNGWYTLCLGMTYIYLRSDNHLTPRVDDQTEEGQGNP